VIVDGTWASIGSANLDRRSFAFNYESNLNIFDPGFASQMETVFERDLALSTPVTLEEWRKRPLAERIFEAIYGLFRWQY
jgi:cardiolipin synthase